MSVVIKGWETLASALEAFPAMTEHTCAFTGHRPGKLPWRYNENDPRCITLKKQLSDIVSILTERGIVHFLSGMALGTDLWAAYAVLESRRQHPNVKLHCILPYCGQADRWSHAYQEQYREILNQSDTIVRVHRDYKDGCLLERNYFMVNSASVVVAVFDGTYRSGTGATVRYAHKLGRELMILNPITFSVTHEGKKD